MVWHPEHIVCEPAEAKEQATTEYEVKFSAQHVIAACLVRGAFNLPDLRPEAIAVMAEIGIDISTHESKHMNLFLDKNVETVITVCGNADQSCPIFPGQLNRHHWPFADPAHATGTEAERLAVFRRVRDEIAIAFRAYADGRRDGQKAKGGT